MFNKIVLDVIYKVADKNGLNRQALAAVVYVESDGVPFWDVNGKKLPAIRFEGHYFHRLLQGPKLQKAVALGLANPKVGGVKNAKSFSGRYDMLRRAMEIDRDAAIMSTSFGVGQVMGENWKTLDYDNPEQLMSVANSGIEGQVELMVRFIKKNSLTAALNRQEWVAFARRYNGKGFKKNQYDTKMEKAYALLTITAASKATVSSSSSSVVDELVLEAQTNLKALGYTGFSPNGKLSSGYTQAVKDYQDVTGLVADGIAGTMTRSQLRVDVANARKETRINSTPYVGAGTAAVAVTAMSSAQEVAYGTKSLLETIGLGEMAIALIVAVVVAGVIFYMLKNHQRDENGS